MTKFELLCGDAETVLKTLDTGMFQVCVTSPPYYGLRDYGTDGQIGLEASPDAYIEKLVGVFREVRRVLRDDGTLWVNIADSYAGSGKGAWKEKDVQKEVYIPDPDAKNVRMAKTWDGIKAKDLIGIPWMLAFALRADGWYLRQAIIWQKPNPMPESVTDRCTKSHEYIFLLSKMPKYYFNHESIREPVTASTISRLNQNTEAQKGSDRQPGRNGRPMKAVLPRYGGKKYTENPDAFYRTKSGNVYDYRPYRNKRDVWTVATVPHKEAHFAMFPEKLIEPCILAASRSGDWILDPFSGGGTTGVVSKRRGRNYVGIEINPEYNEIARKRIEAAREERQISMEAGYDEQ